MLACDIHGSGPGLVLLPGVGGTAALTWETLFAACRPGNPAGRPAARRRFSHRWRGDGAPRFSARGQAGVMLWLNRKTLAGS